MKKTYAFLLLAAITAMTAVGCSKDTRNDIKDDVNDAARTADAKVKNALT